MTFPVEAVPDGNVWLPHHFAYATWAALFLAWYVSNEERKPTVVVGSLLVALFGWYHLWPGGAPTVGALTVLAGLTAAAAALVARSDWREEYPQYSRALLVLLVLVAADDVLQHAFGIPTPLDGIWKHYQLIRFLS